MPGRFTLSYSSAPPLDLAPQALIEAVLLAVTTFTGPAEQHDDMTMVAVKVSEKGVRVGEG